MWVADPSVPSINEFRKSVPHHFNGGGRGWLVLCRYASDRSESLELVMDCGRRRPLYCLDPTNCPPGAGVGFREVFAVGVKLRQVGPIVFASVPHFL